MKQKQRGMYLFDTPNHWFTFRADIAIGELKVGKRIKVNNISELKTLSGQPFPDEAMTKRILRGKIFVVVSFLQGKWTIGQQQSARKPHIKK